MIPKPPFLIIRKGKSFWVENASLNNWTATLQAFREGCFLEASCYDAAGGMWPITKATLTQRPSLFQRLLPWRRVAVELHLGARVEVDIKHAVSQLEEVLRSDTEFIEFLAISSKVALSRFHDANTHQDVIDIAQDCVNK